VKNLYWGDLHAHTSYSLDAYGMGTRIDPFGAYAFAKGKMVTLPDGTSNKIDRPLDFLAVTDHSEFLGVTDICTREVNSLLFHSSYCMRMQADIAQGKTLKHWMWPETRPVPPQPQLCKNDPGACPRATLSSWQKIQEAAKLAYDPCHFTSFNAYEWTRNVGGHLHRNVIFGGTRVPTLPYDMISYPNPRDLWGALDRFCQGDPDCDVIAIPHNPNLSNGLAFKIEGLSKSDLRLKNRYEKLVEIFQIKGSSECLNANANADDADPACEFELLLSSFDEKPLSREVLKQGYVRTALKKGLESYSADKLDPFQFGFVGGTDDHNGTPGDVEEKKYGVLWGKKYSNNLKNQDSYRMSNTNPGGLTGVWAEENTRESIFAALKRRETYATSGPRIAARMFQTWDAIGDPCANPNTTTGIPMGGTITARAGANPRFVVYAIKDQVNIDHIDIIKGTIGRDGKAKEEVFKLAPIDPVNGDSSLCKVWEDKNYNPHAPTFWYARVMEKPSWRWSHYACLEAAKDGHPCDPRLNRQIQERAWTSPIWQLP
jgi:hypothetical protein